MHFDWPGAGIRAANLLNEELLVGDGAGFGWVDFNAALEVSAILDADARGGNIADDGAVFFDIDAIGGVEIADDFAENNGLAGVNFRIELGGGTDGESMAGQGNGAIHFAVDLKVFYTDDFTFDLQASTQARGTA